jgi:hypothetical protein
MDYLVDLSGSTVNVSLNTRTCKLTGGTSQDAHCKRAIR